MSERQTGATPEQVAAAAKRAVDAWGFGEGMPPVLATEVRMAAPFLVPPDERIVAAADLRALWEQFNPNSQEEHDVALRIEEVLGE